MSSAPAPAALPRPPLVELRGVIKDFGEQVKTRVLHGIDLRIEAGEFVALVGPSGSGKSSLLNLIGLLDRASGGEVRIEGHDTRGLSDAELTSLRGTTLGFIFQFHHLVSALTATENLVVPLAARRGRVERAMLREARAALLRFGLAAHADRLPHQLSGGQQQRVAVARALMHRPALVLADEPTGNLDTQTASAIFDGLRQINLQQGTAFLIVTHDPRLSARCDRQISLVDGRVESDRRSA